MKYTKIDNNITKLSLNVPEYNGLSDMVDKYIFDMDRTIGFRKDKKIHKFVGIRDGHSKQMEFTIDSILIDNVEQISGERFKKIKNVDGVILHQLKEIDIYNKVDTSNYRNLVKINNVCDEIEITYIIDLEGLKINNKSYINNNIEYYLENDNEQFIIGDIGNSKKYFIIDKPYAFTETFNNIDIVRHELYNSDGILYYKKIVNALSFYINKMFTLPIYIDANIQFNNDIYYTLTKNMNNVLLSNEQIDGYTNWKQFLNNYDGGKYKRTTNDLNLINYNTSGITINYKNYNIINANISRHFFSFDTSTLSEYGDVTLLSSNFNFNSTNVNNILCLQKATYTDKIPTINNWNSYTGNTYSSFSGSTSIPIPNTDINTNKRTNFILRDYQYDYNHILPTTGITNINIDDSMKTSSLDIYFNINITNKKTLSFNLSSNSFGVLSASSSYSVSGTTIYGAYYNTKIGNNATLESSSYIGTTDNAFGYKFTSSEHKLYRTYFSFYTELLNSYKNIIIRNIRLKFNNYSTKRDNVSVYHLNSSGNTMITNDNVIAAWSMINSYNYKGKYVLNEVNTTTNITLDNNSINKFGYTNFSLIDYNYDYLGKFDIIEKTTDTPNLYYDGIDFNTVKLEVDIEPYLIEGLEYMQVNKGDIFTLQASKNVNDFDIKWFSDYTLSTQIGIGDVLTLDSNYYISGETDYIYAALYDDNDKKVSVNTLSVKIEIVQNKYNKLPIENRDISYNDYIDGYTSIVDIDSVYFKNENSISGVCYTYSRDLDNIYENNLNTSDGDDLGSYNMYNEYDIIDEFYSNSHDVAVVARLDDIDLNVCHKEIDGQIMHEGTRVLLYNSKPSDLDGVYIMDYNLKLIKSSEIDKEDFRYKVNVTSGTYLDYEFHTYYYDESVLPTDNEFNFEIFDASLYGDTIIELGTYYDTIFNANN